MIPQQKVEEAPFAKAQRVFCKWDPFGTSVVSKLVIGCLFAF